MIKLRPAEVADLPAFLRHFKRHGAESGNDGDLIFAPQEEPWDPPAEKFQQDKSASWSKPLSEPGWERCWIVTDSTEIYGNIKLVQQPPLRSALHRATLMIGIERPLRQQGWGTRLISEALTWAKQQPSLEWIDLYVFSHNQTAFALYAKLGFREVGRVPDLFRVRGQRIEDIHMTFNLRQ